MPFVQVSCVFQGRTGYLWAGGFGGLTRFDGTRFLNYHPKNGLIDHNVTAISQNDSGFIFVGTSKGLSVINKSKIENYSRQKWFAGQGVNAFCPGHHHQMYIGTDSGLYSFSKEKIKKLKQFEGMKINALCKSDTSEIYVGTNKGLIIYGHNIFEQINTSSGLPSNNITAISQRGNYIAIGTSKGLSLYNRKTKKTENYFIENGLIDENISALLYQGDKFLWIGSQTGLLRFDGRAFVYYNISYDNNSNVIRSIIKDREDNIWIGTHSGLFRYRDDSFSTFDNTSGPGNAFVYQIFRDNQQNLWACSDNNGVYRMQQGFFKRYGMETGLGTNVCHAGMQDKNGRLLFATKNGLAEFSNEQFRNIKLPSEFKGSYEMLLQMDDGKIWIAGGNGIASLVWINNHAQIKYYPLPVKEIFQSYALCKDSNGNLYIGTQSGGLFKLKNDSIINFSKTLRISEPDFFSVKYFKGHLFCATLNGVLVIDLSNGSSRYITEANGLNSELVYSLEFASNNKYLWIGTNQGVNRLDLEKFMEQGRVEISSYGKLQGFMGVECNSNGIWEDPDGTLWFGTVSGIVKHEPFNIKKNTIRNSTLIQKIQLQSEDTLLANNSKLSSDHNTITFYYRGICLTNPEKVVYIKKLEGLEKEWSAPSNEDYSKYANLAPGKYTFKVKSRNNEGIWDEISTDFSFTILAPFYTTWWFILLSIVSIITIVGAVIFIRINNIKKKQKSEFERKVEMSKIELKALRSQMNPHFIFNSLNSIQHYIYNSKSEEAIKYLSKFARLVRIILNNSNKVTVTVEEDLEALKLYLELEKMRFEDKFDYEVKIDESVDADYDIMPPMLIQPFVENAILHGLNPKPGKGKLTITFTSRNNFLICTITDDGIGREKSAEIKRTMPMSRHKSLGMKITEDRLRILNEVNHSQLSVTIKDLKTENGESAGTKVELYVPLNG